jgi:RNA polymerase sigma-70 factor (ECF subfamily)
MRQEHTPDAVSAVRAQANPVKLARATEIFAALEHGEPLITIL